jgi:transposase-like protein
MATYDREYKAQAVARVLAGETQAGVARALGLRRSTLAAWVHEVQRAATALPEKQEPTLAERAHDLAEVALREMDDAWLASIRRVRMLAPEAEMRDAVGAVKILGEQRALAQGKPTAITGEAMAFPVDASPDQLVGIADELRRRRERHAAAPRVSVEVG